MIGLVSGLMYSGKYTLFETLTNAILSGTIGVCYALAFTRNIWLLAVGIALQVVISVKASSDRLVFDLNDEVISYFRYYAAGFMLCIILSYTFFIIFINKQGIKQIKLSTEMDLARKIHNSLVPDILHEDNKVEVFGKSISASEVGGDLIYFREIENGYFFNIADVSGHGVSAGIIMGMYKSVLNSNLIAGIPFVKSLENINKNITELKNKSTFITATSLKIGLNYECEYAIQGHLPLIVLRDNEVINLTQKQPGIGIIKDYSFATANFNLRSSDILLLLTDGLIETFNKKREQFSLESVLKIVSENSGLSASGLGEKLFSDVQNFGKIDDDLSILLIKIK